MRSVHSRMNTINASPSHLILLCNMCFVLCYIFKCLGLSGISNYVSVSVFGIMFA